MIKVLFFARLREALGCQERSLPIEETTVAALRDQLIREGGAAWKESLGEENVLCAVNQRLAKPDEPVRSGDEVAFYPPVTGG